MVLSFPDSPSDELSPEELVSITSSKITVRSFNPEELVDQRIWVEEKGPGRVLSYNEGGWRRSSTHSIQFESTGSERPVKLIVGPQARGLKCWRYLVEEPKPDWEETPFQNPLHSTPQTKGRKSKLRTLMSKF